MTAHVPSHPTALVPHHRTFGAFLAAIVVVMVVAIGALILPAVLQPGERVLSNWTEQFPGKAADDIARVGGAADQRGADWTVRFPGKAADDLMR